MHPDRSVEDLESRLRAMPPPPVPASLEARLLAAIPVDRPTPSRRPRWPVWAGVAGATAVVCLLIALIWPNRASVRPDHTPRNDVVQTRPEDPSANYSEWLADRQAPNPPELPVFSWPVEEASPMRASTSIPADLLN
jgi:hypothetical protein